MDFLPIQYHIEVYQNTFINDPAMSWQCSTPPASLSVGDYFNPAASDAFWNESPKAGETFRIKTIEHIFWRVENSHIGHKIMICLETVKDPRD